MRSGSWLLPDDFFSPRSLPPARKCAGFNPLHSSGGCVRDHRKLLVCDDATIFIGGSMWPMNTMAMA